MLLQIGAEKAVQDGLIDLRDYTKYKHSIELYKSVTTPVE